MVSRSPPSPGSGRERVMVETVSSALRVLVVEDSPVDARADEHR